MHTLIQAVVISQVEYSNTSLCNFSFNEEPPIANTEICRMSDNVHSQWGVNNASLCHFLQSMKVTQYNYGDKYFLLNMQ